MIEQVQRVITNIVERVGTQGAAKERLGSPRVYYAVLFESKKLNADEKCRYRMRIVEISREREQFFVWTFPDFKTNKKLATHLLESPGVVYKLHDDSWVFVSTTMTFTNDFIFVQRMTGSKNEIKPIFKEMALEY